MTEPIDHARKWMRPAFSATVIGGVAVCMMRLPAEHVFDALCALLWAGGALYLIRGVLDAGAMERILRIWKGQSNG
jgi:hypothetical protein